MQTLYTDCKHFGGDIMTIEFIANGVLVKLGNVEEYKFDKEAKELHVKIDKDESYFVANVTEVKEI